MKPEPEEQKFTFDECRDMFKDIAKLVLDNLPPSAGMMVKALLSTFVEMGFPVKDTQESICTLKKLVAENPDLVKTYLARKKMKPIEDFEIQEIVAVFKASIGKKIDEVLVFSVVRNLIKCGHGPEMVTYTKLLIKLGQTAPL